MSRNSWGIHMSSQPLAGQGRLCSTSHTPEKSGLPSFVRGVGAERSGLPFASRGMPAVGYVIHWACTETAAVASAISHPTMVLLSDKMFVILVVLVADVFQKLGIGNQTHVFLHRPRLGVRLGI